LRVIGAPFQGLDNEIGDDALVMGVDARAVSVEDAGAAAAHASRELPGKSHD
jgi:hypothetical protein